MLTDQQIHDLAAPFTPAEHGWVNGSPYLLKSAIMRRLSQVDPAWCISQPMVMHQSADIIVLSADLTIAGVTRSGLGTGIIIRTKTDRKTNTTTDVTGYELQKGMTKAWKSATSDLLPRAANNFAVGAYLRDAPKFKTPQEFNDYIADLLHDSRTVWTRNGGRQRVKDTLDALDLTWSQIASLVEPGRTLNQLTDTTITEAEFIARCAVIATALASISVPTN